MSKQRISKKLKLTPEFLRENGEPKFVILSYSQYETMMQALEDADDLATLRHARTASRGQKTIVWEDAKKTLTAKRRKTA